MPTSSGKRPTPSGPKQSKGQPKQSNAASAGTKSKTNEKIAELEKEVKELKLQCEIFRKEYNFAEVKKTLSITDETIIQQLTDQNRKLNQQIQELESASNNSRSDNVSAKQDESKQVSDSEMRKAEAKEDARNISAHGTEMETLKKQLEEAKSKLLDYDNIKSELASKKSEIDELTTELEKAKKQLLDFDKIESELASKQSKVDELTTELENARKQLANYKQEESLKTTKTTENQKTDKSDNGNKGSEIEKIRNELSSKESEINTLRTELEDEKKKMKDTERKLKEKEAELEIKKEEITTKDNEVKQMKTQLNNKDSEIAHNVEELKKKAVELEKQEKELEKKDEEVQRKIAETEELRKKINSQEKKQDKGKGESADKHNDNGVKYKKELEEAKDEIEDLKNRLSKVIGAKITDGNPDIADLSDMNRPTKLAEKYAELYDNEWTDAYEELETKRKLEEKKVIETLLSNLKDVYAFCQNESKDYEANIKKSALAVPGTEGGRPKTPNLTATSRKLFVDLRKTFAPFLIDDVFKKYKKKNEKNLNGYTKTTEYIKTCVEICWLMSVQDPPVVLDVKDRKGPFDGDKYRTYTKSGKTFDYIVWPPMCLKEAGPLLGKGVAQAK